MRSSRTAPGHFGVGSVARSVAILVLSMLAFAGFGCSADRPVGIEGGDPEPSAPGPEPMARPGLQPGGYYSCFWSNDLFAYSELSFINVHNGRATRLYSLSVDPYPDQNPEAFGPMTFGITFDLDGTIYCTMNLISYDPSLVQSQLARIDAATGEVTMIGEPVPFNTAGSDIDSCGNLYVCGFQVDALGYIWGNSYLWRVDKVTGDFTMVGDTGHTNWMDLAFDADDTLWGTFDNQLYTIDTMTGASTLVTEIHGVPDSGEPHWMEVMSIAFDKHGTLFGTGLTVYWLHPDASPVMRIDTMTGQATVVGYSHTPDYNHGGDIMPSTARVAHKIGEGEFELIEVSLDALRGHLAHGDYVPGTAGHPCE